MGYMTTLTILNDGYSNVENNPEEFLAAIDDAMRSGRKGIKFGPIGTNAYKIGNSSEVVKIAPTYHMDDSKLFLCKCNDMYDLGKVYDVEKREDIEFQLSLIESAKSILKYAEENLKKKIETINRETWVDVVDKTIENLKKEDIIIDSRIYKNEKIGCYGKILVPKEFLQVLEIYDGLKWYVNHADEDVDEYYILFIYEYSLLELNVAIDSGIVANLFDFINEEQFNKLISKVETFLEEIY